jgi:hypothetical protein
LDTITLAIDLSSPIVVYVEVAETEIAKRTPFKIDEWSMHVENFRRIEISWLDSKQAYEIACFDSQFHD